jgi:imidazolonepropionase-like amidohydrolase
MRHGLGLRCAVHARCRHLVEAALRARAVDFVDHCKLLVERPDLLEKMPTQRVAYVPNLTSWAPVPTPKKANRRSASVLERAWEAVRLVIASGVTLAVGIDSHTDQLHVEVSAFRLLGPHTEQALATVTANGPDQLGRLESGYREDLLLDAPRKDLAATSTPHTVIASGQPFDRVQLRSHLFAGKRASVRPSLGATAMTRTLMPYAIYSGTERSFDSRWFVRGESRTRPIKSSWRPVNETRLR